MRGWDVSTDNPEDEDFNPCGYSYDHKIIDMEDGHWYCTECGAEGWDD